MIVLTRSLRSLRSGEFDGAVVDRRSRSTTALSLFSPAAPAVATIQRGRLRRRGWPVALARLAMARLDVASPLVLAFPFALACDLV